MSKEKEEKWFETWFDSPYYHILYQNRNESEARDFINKLLLRLSPAKEQCFLDLACGKGRHALQISEQGFKVLGVDLSSNSIEFAQQYKSQLLSFEVHDMREVIPNQHFDFILNLFTSFGYFDDVQDNIKMLSSIHQMLKKDGVFVLDFFNSYKVISHLIESQTFELSNIHFHISKNVVDKKIIKSINFVDAGKQYHFEEKVNVFSDIEITEMLSQSGFNILNTYGNYQLEPFNKYTSDRFIVVAEKK